MKKFLLITAALMLVCGGLFAQNQKGKRYLGTSLFAPWQTNPIDGMGFATGITYQKLGDVKTTVVGIAPDFGMFISDRAAVGIALGYTHSSAKTGNVTVSTNSYGINPYARFFMPLGDRLSFFMQPGVLYSSSKVGDLDASHVLYAGIKPGFEYKLSGKFDLIGHVGNLGYYDFGNSNNAFDFSLNMASVDLGVVFVF